VELTIQLLATHYVVFWSNWVSAVDAVVVILCFMDVFVIALLTNNVGVLRVFRIARVLQASKALRSYKRFWRVIGSVQHTLDSAFWWNLIFFLVIFIYSLLGLQLLGGRVNQDQVCATRTDAPEWSGVDQRASFDTFFQSFITVFVMVSGKWYHTATMTGDESSHAAMFMWITMFAVGNFILLNLLLAVLIDNIAANAAKVEKADEAERIRLSKRANFGTHIHAMCKRLHGLGITGKYLGAYENDMEGLMAPLDEEVGGEEGVEATSSGETGGDGVTRTSKDKYRTSKDRFSKEEEEGEEERGGVEIMHYDDGVEDDRDVEAGLEEEAYPGQVPAMGTEMGMSPLPGQVTDEEYDVEDGLSTTEPGTGSGSGGGRMACLPPGCVGDSAGSAMGAGVGMGKGAVGKGGKKKKKKKEEEEDEEDDCLHEWFAPCGWPKRTKRMNFREQAEADAKVFAEQKAAEDAKPQLVFEEGNASCFIFGIENPIRTTCQAIYLHWTFESFIIFLIFANCVTLAMDSPSLDEESSEAKTLKLIDFFFNAVFIIEAILNPNYTLVPYMDV